MKKWMIVILLLVAVLVAGTAVFIATFDINRYRPQILKQIQQATGKEARIGRIGLTWKNGIAAQVDSLALYDAGDKEPDAALEAAVVHLELAPLLRKQIKVSGVSLNGPRLVVERFADGRISVAGIQPQSASASGNPADSASGQALAAPAFLIDSVKIFDGHIRFIDHTPSAPMDLTLSDLDAEIKNISLDRAISFAARVQIFGDSQNIAVGGKITPPVNGKPALLEDFSMEMDLGRIDLAQLSESIPAVRSAGLKAPLAGVLKARIERVALEPAEMAGAQAQLSLKDGSLSLASVPLPLENIDLEASIQNGNAEVKNLSTELAGGRLAFQGTIQNISGRAASAFKMSVRELSVAQLARAASPQAPRLEGRLSLDFEGRAEGLDSARLLPSLDGQGRLALKDGVLVNSNLLRTLVEKISKIPGVGEGAISRIPPQYLAKINEPSTILRPFEMPFAVQRERVFFERLVIPTELFTLAGNGSVGFDRSLAIQGGVQLDQGFSQSLVAVAPPTQYFTNPAGHIEIQLTIQGVPPAVQIVPNLDAALQRVGQQVVTDLLQKKDPKEILAGFLSGGATQQTPEGAAAQAAPAGGGIPLEPAAGGEQQQAQPQQSTEEALMGLLGNALRKNE